MQRKRAKSHCNCIGLKELRGPIGMKISFSHYWVAPTLKWLKIMGVDSPFAALQSGSAVKILFKNWTFFRYVTVMNIVHLASIFVRVNNPTLNSFTLKRHIQAIGHANSNTPI